MDCGVRPGGITAAAKVLECKDLLLRIVSCVQQKDEGAVLLTCKSWNAVIQEVLLAKATKALAVARRNKGVQVCVRVRPHCLGAHHPGKAAKGDVLTLGAYSCQITVPVLQTWGYGLKKHYTFDNVFDQRTTQERVYTEVGDIVQSVLAGRNASIFCYGQTGSGKTYTMMGSEDNPGIIPRVFSDLFRMNPGVNIKAQVSMLELQQEKLRDLLGDKERKLVIKLNQIGQVVVEDAVLKPAEAVFPNIFTLFRRTGASHANLYPSHLILTMFLVIQDTRAGTKTNAKLTFVDMASSERLQSTSTGVVRRKSLSSLRDVLSAIKSGHQCIPYFNHRLTWLMADSLGGTARTMMIVNLSALPENAAETHNSLEYADAVQEASPEAVRHRLLASRIKEALDHIRG